MKKTIDRANHLSNLVQELYAATQRDRENVIESTPETFDQRFDAFVISAEREGQARRDHREALKVALTEAGTEAGLKAEDIDLLLACVRGDVLPSRP